MESGRGEWIVVIEVEFDAYFYWPLVVTSLDKTKSMEPGWMFLILILEDAC